MIRKYRHIYCEEREVLQLIVLQAPPALESFCFVRPQELRVQVFHLKFAFEF